MGKSLETILDDRFKLMYHMNVTISDLDNMDVLDIDWYTNRLERELNTDKE